MHANTYDQTKRIDVLPDGRVSWIAGGKGGWISLSGINYTVPEQAIVPERSKQFVFVVDANDRVERREVTTGRRRPGEVEIVDGLQPGERVITEGTQKVRDGAVVRLVESPTG